MRFPNFRTRASTLLVAILTTGIISTALGSYLYLVQTQNRSVMFSMSWNAALPMAEAGIEEAMTHMTLNKLANLGADSWSNLSGIYSKQRSLGDGYYLVSVVPPTNGAYVGLSNYSIHSAGFIRRPDNSTYVSRTVVVGVQYQSWLMGFISRSNIELGGGFSADSYDSGDTNYSTGGFYDPAKRDDDTLVGTISTNSGSKIGGNVQVRGIFATGPGGSVAAAGNFAVGDSAFVDSGAGGFQSGHRRDDLNLQISDVPAPVTNGFPLVSYSTNGTNYLLLDQPNHWAGSLSSGTRLLVKGPTSLYVSGNVNIDSVTLLPGASLKLYVAGASTTFNGESINEGGNPLDFAYYGLPSNTGINMSGNARIVGFIYAPNAALNCGGDAQVFGAVAVMSIKGAGNFDFHFDENLARKGPLYSFYISSWDEY